MQVPTTTPPSSAHHDAPSPPLPPQVHGPDKFAEIFLGEFDTPEYIWNHEMRRRMIEKLALHVGEFPLLLQANCTAKYDHCPLPLSALHASAHHGALPPHRSS